MLLQSSLQIVSFPLFVLSLTILFLEIYYSCQEWSFSKASWRRRTTRLLGSYFMLSLSLLISFCGLIGIFPAHHSISIPEVVSFSLFVFSLFVFSLFVFSLTILFLEIYYCQEWSFSKANWRRTTIRLGYYSMFGLCLLISFCELIGVFPAQHSISIPTSGLGKDLPQEIREEIASQIPGFLTIDIPQEMRIQQEYIGRVCITQKPEVSCNKFNARPRVEPIQTSSLVQVFLEGSQFSIDKRSREEQVVTELNKSQWSWSIIPLKPSKQLLTVRVSLWIKSINNQKDSYQDIELTLVDVDVRRDYIYTLKEILKNHGVKVVILLSVFLAVKIFSRFYGGVSYFLDTFKSFSGSMIKLVQGIQKMANNSDAKSQTYF